MLGSYQAVSSSGPHPIQQPNSARVIATIAAAVSPSLAMPRTILLHGNRPVGEATAQPYAWVPRCGAMADTKRPYSV
jgi:hypothetical protein